MGDTEKGSGWKNLLLTVLAAMLLCGFALAVPSADVLENAEEIQETEETEEDSGDEYDFL